MSLAFDTLAGWIFIKTEFRGLHVFVANLSLGSNDYEAMNASKGDHEALVSPFQLSLGNYKTSTITINPTI